MSEEGKEYTLMCCFSKVNCWDCTVKKYCYVWNYIMDLNCIRYTCPCCHRNTREEHTNYCPFCGKEIEGKVKE